MESPENPTSHEEPVLLKRMYFMCCIMCLIDFLMSFIYFLMTFNDILTIVIDFIMLFMYFHMSFIVFLMIVIDFLMTGGYIHKNDLGCPGQFSRHSESSSTNQCIFEYFFIENYRNLSLNLGSSSALVI